MIIIIIINLLTWGKIFNQAILGEGYYYFDLQQSLIVDGKIQIDKYDVFPRIIFDIIAPIFKDNLFLYLVFQFGIMLLISITLYFVILKISKSKFVASFTTLIFSINYVGSYEMMAIGNYQRFVQRVPNLFFLFIALWFLYKYFNNKDIKYYLISFLFFSFGMFLAHYSLFLLPVFALFPVTYYVINRKSGNLIMSIIISLSFILISVLLISKDPHATQNGVINIRQILAQFTNITIPPPATIKLANIFRVSHPYRNLVIVLSIPVILIYCFGFFLVRKRMPQLSELYLAGVFSLPVIFGLNLITGRMDPLTSFGQDRYYYYPSIITSILISSIIFSLTKSKTILRYIAIMFLGIFLIYNCLEINKQIDANQYKSEAMKKYLSYIRKISPQFNQNTIVALPSSLIWPQSMIIDTYKKPSMIFIAFEEGWEIKIPQEKISDTFVIDYDYEREPGRDFDPKKGKLIDLTSKFRNGEKIEYLKQ